MTLRFHSSAHHGLAISSLRLSLSCQTRRSPSSATSLTYASRRPGRQVTSLSAMKNNSLVFLARRVLTVNRPTSNWRFYCSPPSSSSPPHNNKLFVAGLSWSVDEKSLKDAFSSFGEVTEVRIVHKDTGRSRGFGFVNFSKEDDADSAKDAMDGKALLGRPLRISFALEKFRGGPVVVPRLTTVGDSTNRNY